MSSSNLAPQSPHTFNQAMSAIIIDDEPLAHDVLRHHIQAHNLTANGPHARPVNIRFQAHNATDALKWLSENDVDLIFLDIKMPYLTGIELVKVLANRPQIVFVTAFQEHAATAFELDVTDYLVKPVSLPRLQQAIGKVSQRLVLSNTSSTQNTESYVMLNLSGTKRKIYIRDIQWFEAYGNYVKVWLEDEMLLANSTFKQMLDSLPHVDLLSASQDNTANQFNEGLFAQIHKSYGVNLSRAKALAGDRLIMMNDIPIKIGKTFKKALKNRFC